MGAASCLFQALNKQFPFVARGGNAHNLWNSAPLPLSSTPLDVRERPSSAKATLRALSGGVARNNSPAPAEPCTYAIRRTTTDDCGSARTHSEARGAPFARGLLVVRGGHRGAGIFFGPASRARLALPAHLSSTGRHGPESTRHRGEGLDWDNHRGLRIQWGSCARGRHTSNDRCEDGAAVRR